MYVVLVAIIYSLFFPQDWDSNGTIDFAEFVFAFSSWVDIEDEGGD